MAAPLAAAFDPALLVGVIGDLDESPRLALAVAPAPNPDRADIAPLAFAMARHELA